MFKVTEFHSVMHMIRVQIEMETREFLMDYYTMELQKIS
jgi:hypothetical protein